MNSVMGDAPSLGARFRIGVTATLLVVLGLLAWRFGVNYDLTADCDSRFAVQPPASATDIECRDGDHSAQLHFWMPTGEVKTWWAGQSKTPLQIRDVMHTEGKLLDLDGRWSTTVSRVETHYPEDEDGLLVVDPWIDGRSQVMLTISLSDPRSRVEDSG